MAAQGSWHYQCRYETLHRLALSGYSQYSGSLLTGKAQHTLLEVAMRRWHVSRPAVSALHAYAPAVSRSCR